MALLPERLTDLAAHIPFLLMNIEDGKRKVGFNGTRFVELLGAVIVIVYLLSKQVSLIENKIDLITQHGEIERHTMATAIEELKGDVKRLDERLYGQATRRAKGGN